jgi:hypothetical protein
MVEKMKKKQCKHCKELFRPDPRNATRQRYCSKPQCRKASKASSQKRWLDKPENRDYFRGPQNVARVQSWRRDHPGYWRRKKNQGADALQDPWILQPAVLICLIAQMTGYALQDDIALAARRMQQLGSDILYPQLKGESHGRKISDPPQSYPEPPQTVQLARSSPGP